MKLTNSQIYNYGQSLAVFSNCDIKMPVRINFFLQKNIQTIMAAGREIEEARLSIAKMYGEISEDQNGYFIPPEKQAFVMQELNDLLAIEQDLNIHVFKLADFDGIELTYQQMSAIMFMVEEN